MTASPREIHVHAPGRDAHYRVLVGSGLLDTLGILTRGVLGPSPQGSATRAFLAHDAGLPAGIIGRAADSLTRGGFAVTLHAVPSGETSKSFVELERLHVALALARHERAEPVIALGGGVIGDLVGFAAATYRRGVPVIQCPTTLLAMVDASVGGKTAINLDPSGTGLKKNLLGVFHHPALVLADISALQSLPPREFRAGLAECVKHAMLAPQIPRERDAALPLLEWMSANAPALRVGAVTDEGSGGHGGDRGASPILAEFIARNIAIKAAVVAGDPYELADDDVGGRALLNLGHTFAHVLESLPGLRLVEADGTVLAPGHVLHGEAVALGLLCATRLGIERGRLPPGMLKSLRELYSQLHMPLGLENLPSGDVAFARMLHDKKTMGNRVRFVVPFADGTRCPAGAEILVADEVLARSLADVGWSAVTGVGGR